MSSDDGWGFADIYGMDDASENGDSDLQDVQSEDWRNILVLGRATGRTVYPETLSLIGHAKYLADALGCRVEVLLIGESLDKPTEFLKNYPVDNVYRVKAPDYAPIDHTGSVLYEVVRKRRPELVLVFQSRSGDAVTAYAAQRLGAGFALGASKVEIDTMDRLTQVIHQGKNPKFNVSTRFESTPAFVSVQRGLFRAPMEDPYGTTNVYDLDVDVGKTADIQVGERRDPPAATVENGERVVVAGSRIHDAAGMDSARALADKLGAVFAVTRSIVDRGLAGADDPVIAARGRHVAAARLVVTVGCTGSLDVLEAIHDGAVIAAVGCGKDDPVNRRATYRVEGDVKAAVQSVSDGL